MLAILIKSLTEFNSPASDHYNKDFGRRADAQQNDLQEVYEQKTERMGLGL